MKTTVSLILLLSLLSSVCQAAERTSSKQALRLDAAAAVQQGRRRASIASHTAAQLHNPSSRLSTADNGPVKEVAYGIPSTVTDDVEDDTPAESSTTKSDETTTTITETISSPETETSAETNSTDPSSSPAVETTVSNPVDDTSATPSSNTTSVSTSASTNKPSTDPVKTASHNATTSSNDSYFPPEQPQPEIWKLVVIVVFVTLAVVLCIMTAVRACRNRKRQQYEDIGGSEIQNLVV